MCYVVVCASYKTGRGVLTCDTNSSNTTIVWIIDVDKWCLSIVATTTVNSNVRDRAQFRTTSRNNSSNSSLLSADGSNICLVGTSEYFIALVVRSIEHDETTSGSTSQIVTKWFYSQRRSVGVPRNDFTTSTISTKNSFRSNNVTSGECTKYLIQCQVNEIRHRADNLR